MSEINYKGSDYLVFVDEAGDHLLTKYDKDFPVFVLSFIIIHKTEYCEKLLPEFSKLKLKYFYNLNTIFHERDIRKAVKDFEFLTNKEVRESFLNDLTNLIERIDFTVISTVVNKSNLIKQYKEPHNPYNIAVKFALERIRTFLENKNNKKKIVITFESKGKKEDKDLELEFLKEASKQEYDSCFNIDIEPKASNLIGLQLADLTARPIGRHVINPNQENRAMEIIKKKLYCNNVGNYNDWGLKLFPK